MHISKSPSPVKKWEEIIDNAYQFRNFSKNVESFTAQVVGKFSNWYYFPSLDIFAPNKFLGYRDTTVSGYKGFGHGTQAKNALAPFFIKVPPRSEHYPRLIKKLKKFLNKTNKKISKKTVSTGGIYIPKPEFDKIELPVDIELFDVVAKDIAQMKAENATPESLLEGKISSRLVSHYERNPKLRAMTISLKGTSCAVCGFNFRKVYGEIGQDYIEVHHLIPVSKIKKEHKVNPATEMEVLCANCHRMIHRSKDKILSIDDMKRILKSQNSISK